MTKHTPGRAPPPRGPLIALAVAALASTVVVAVAVLASRDSDTQDGAATSSQPGPFRGSRLPPQLRGKPAPSFNLRDARGGRLSTAELHGRPYVLTFLFTNCPDVCPLIGQELRRTLELLDQDASKAAVVAVSVDPEGDTSETVRLWLRRHRLPDNFHYLIGSEAQLRPTWKAYFAAPQQPGVEESLHTASIWLVDGRGRWRTKFSAGVPVPPQDIAHDLRVLLREEPV